jgi:hypothetical protein
MVDNRVVVDMVVRLPAIRRSYVVVIARQHISSKSKAISSMQSTSHGKVHCANVYKLIV